MGRAPEVGVGLALQTTAGARRAAPKERRSVFTAVRRRLFGCFFFCCFCGVYSTVSVTVFDSQLLQGVGLLLRWRERAGGVVRRSNRAVKHSLGALLVSYWTLALQSTLGVTARHSWSWAVKRSAWHCCSPPVTDASPSMRAMAVAGNCAPRLILDSGSSRAAAVDDPHISALAAPEAVDDPHL